MNLRWGNNSRLTNSEAHNEPTSKHLSIVSSSCYVDDNTNYPDDAKLACGPDTSYKTKSEKKILRIELLCERTNFVACNESNQSSSNTSNLDHSSNVADSVLKSRGIECL